jgi:hypothetical protein
MKLGLISNSSPFTVAACAIALLAPLGAVACSGTSSSPITSPPGQSNNQDGGAPVQNEPPHALATIVLGESHFSGGTTSTPVVSASFLPDSTAIPAACTTTIGGCTIPTPAVCNASTIVCASDQVCALDATCHPHCVTACTAQCPSGQVCQLDSTGSQSCQTIQTFNGGDLVFSGSGLAIPVTLLAPAYSFTSASTGSPFVPGGAINVTGTGATGAGFAAFQESFTATSLLQTVPALSKLTAADVYNPAGFSLGWQPGSDSISILIAGPAGSAECAATDATGAFTIPAAVVTKVSGAGNPGVTVSVTRARMSEKTDGKTEGSLTGATVQPLGYLDLMTSSSESFEVVGCGSSTGEGGLTSCSDGCVDLLTSASDCGACGHSCGGGYCSAGTCYGTTTSCTTPYTSCNGACVNLSISATNCGDCGFACPSGESCVSGVCSEGTSCPTSYTACSDGCQDLTTSSTDCGECGNSCDGGTCNSGFCSTSTTTCSSCESTAESGTCSSYYVTCEDDVSCSDYASCMSGCSTGDTSCESLCEEDYSTGMTEAENLRSCICSTACASSCGTSAYCTETL